MDEAHPLVNISSIHIAEASAVQLGRSRAVSYYIVSVVLKILHLEVFIVRNREENVLFRKTNDMEGNRLLDVFRCTCATAATGSHFKFDKTLLRQRVSLRCKLRVQSFYLLDITFRNLLTWENYK